jgi:hypothetical protein
VLTSGPGALAMGTSGVPGLSGGMSGPGVRPGAQPGRAGRRGKSARRDGKGWAPAGTIGTNLGPRLGVFGLYTRLALDYRS